MHHNGMILHTYFFWVLWIFAPNRRTFQWNRKRRKQSSFIFFFVHIKESQKIELKFWDVLLKVAGNPGKVFRNSFRVREKYVCASITTFPNERKTKNEEREEWMYVLNLQYAVVYWRHISIWPVLQIVWQMCSHFWSSVNKNSTVPTLHSVVLFNFDFALSPSFFVWKQGGKREREWGR